MKLIYKNILVNREANRKMLAILLDPEKCKGSVLSGVIAMLKMATPDLIFIGGSQPTQSIDSLIELLKEETNAHIVIFPGHYLQFSKKADAMLFLSLISGRNPEFLIGQHVSSSVTIKQSDIEVIPTAYLLIDGGKTSSVEYISNTKPIPRDKNEIALATAIAGELLGMHLIYLEAGSGALYPVPPEMVEFLRYRTTLPLVVGGGIKTVEELENAYDAGADMVVVGNIFEKEPEKIIEFVNFTKEYNMDEFQIQ